MTTFSRLPFFTIPEYPPGDASRRADISLSTGTINYAGKCAREIYPRVYIFLFLLLEIISRREGKRVRRARRGDSLLPCETHRSLFRISSRFVRSDTLYAKQSGDCVIDNGHF